ncbi:hypothetical protein NLG97_g9692 [Lecanicillium saksenae]|uniref:Uncharacterized protein n=1 Tax=Lecanicillium saksenae TaxID=468837 RepID=A0ACC1QH40_9HYPO|nr:hypothetical protein NLG97_g9692 [Lecanicillium saksenae]
MSEMEVDNTPPPWALTPPPAPPGWEASAPASCNTLGNDEDCMIVEDCRASGTLCDATTTAAVDLNTTASGNRSTVEDVAEIELVKDSHALEEPHASADDFTDTGMVKNRTPVYHETFDAHNSAASDIRLQQHIRRQGTRWQP